MKFILDKTGSFERSVIPAEQDNRYTYRYKTGEPSFHCSLLRHKRTLFSFGYYIDVISRIFISLHFC